MFFFYGINSFVAFNSQDCIIRSVYLFVFQNGSLIVQFRYQQSIRQMRVLASLLLIAFIFGVVSEESHKMLELDKPYQQELKQVPYMGRYVFNISEEQVKKLDSDKWFFFVEVEPAEEKSWVETQIELSVGKKDSENSTKAKICDSRSGGVDSCFLTNKLFDYKTQQVHVRVHCKGPCKYKLSGEISTPFKLQPGTTIKMDFEQTAYSKIFVLDTTKSEDFDQLRIILRPEGFLRFATPISLYLNEGESIPTKSKHSMKGMTLWDDGQGIFLETPTAKGIFTILVEGPEKNILTLQTQLISFQQTNAIKENLPFFDYLGSESSKKYKVKVNPAKGVCFQMTTFSGAIKLTNIYDQNLKQIDEQFSPLYRTYGQLEYQLDSTFFKKNKEDFKIDQYIVFEVEGVKQSTFVIESYELDLSIAHLAHERTRYVELAGKSYHQYYIEIIELNVPQFKKATFEIILTTEQDKSLKTRFFNCKKEHGKQCELKNSQVQSSKLSSTDVVEINTYTTQHSVDGVEVYRFNIPASKFTKVDNDVKKYILTILIENKDKQEQLYTLQYIETGKNIYLKEGQVRKDRVAVDQSKYYVFTNSNEDVEEIRIHVMEISGRVFMQGYLKDPRVSDQSGKEIMDYHNSVRYEKIKNNQTVYLKIQGKESAYYSIQIQLIKQSERQWWNRTHDGKGKGFNEIILVEDIAYEFNIPAHSKEVFQIHASSRIIDLDLSSLLPLQLCMTEELKKAPFTPNCEQITQLMKKKNYYGVILEKGQIVNIGVKNDNEKDVKFNIRFTNPNKTKPATDDSSKVDSKCWIGVLGKVSKYDFKKDTSSCYTYFLDKKEDFEVMVDIISDDYNKVKVFVELNKEERVEVMGAVHVFKKAQVEKICKNNVTCPVKIFIDTEVDTEIRFTAQYLTGTVYLLDGIANQFTGTKQARYFAYQLYNKINTTIVLENKNGYYKFYGKVVEANSFWNKNQSFPSDTDKVVTSNNPFYYQYQISVLSQAQIEASNCKECMLLIKVVRQEQSYNPNEKSRFVIECTQEKRFLKDNQNIASFLAKRSLTFFEYYNEKNGSLLVSVNTQNQDCINTYIKKGLKSRASGSDYDQRSDTTNPSRVIVENAVQGQYSITLQATDDCYYSIDVNSAANQTLVPIDQGIYKDVTLDKNEVMKFVYENKNIEDIKILTLHINGQITINVKPYANIKELVADNSTRPKYVWSGKDFLKISKSATNYCSNCTYLIVVTAERQTKTSIMIPTANSEFPIVMDSSIKDELNQGEIEWLRIFTQTITQFEINVHYGEVKVELISPNKNSTYFSKTYSATSATQYQNITTNDSGPTTDYTFMRYNKVKITAIRNTAFSFGFVSNQKEQLRGNKVKYGVPQYVTLTAKKRQCLRGLLDDDKEQFLISITGDKQLDLMNSLYIECEINSSKLELSKNIAKNQMIVTYSKPTKVLPAEYEFCMTSQQDIFLTFIHSSKLNYFPESKAIMVSKEMNLSFYAEGKSLIEINECTSRATTTISHSFNSMGGINSEIRQVRKTNNIIEFNYYGPVYVNVKADSATIAWRKKDDLNKRGLAYDEYTNNKIRIEKDGKMLGVKVYPLKKIADKPSVSFTTVEYTAYIAKEEMNLYDAMNCNNGKYLSKSVSTNTDTQPLLLDFEADRILSHFKNESYVLIGVLAIATSNITNDTKYRFAYPYQQFLMAALSSDKNLEKHDDISIDPVKPQSQEKSSWFNTFVLYFTITVVLVFLAIWVYRKWIKRLLKRHKRQQLSEQGTGEVRYQEFTSYT